MALPVLIGLASLTLILTYNYLKRAYSRSKDDPPGPEPHIFFGNLINSGLLTNKVAFHEVLLRYQRQYGDTFVFWFGSHPCVVFCLPEHAHAIFSDRHTFEQSPLFLKNFDLLCPHSIFHLMGATWKRHIRVLLPTFKRAKVVRYSNAIVDCTDRFVDQHLHDGQIPLDLKQHCQALTMNMLSLIGFDFDLESDTDASLRDAMDTFAFETVAVTALPWLPRWLIRIYLKFNWKYQRAHRLLYELTEKILAQEQANPQSGDDHRRNNLIASMVSAMNEQANDEQIASGLTRAEIFDEILSALLAGYETTSTALAWFIYYVSKHPHVQERLRDELREQSLLIEGESAHLPDLTQDKLDALVYCECVVNEVLRLAPIAGATTRIALNDTSVGSVRVRRGQTILIALHNINIDPRFWHATDPATFAPERFLHGDEHHHPFALLPFGGGHRGCIGQDLARLELKTIIARLVQRGITFEDTPENTGGYVEGATCSPKHVVVRVHIQ